MGDGEPILLDLAEAGRAGREAAGGKAHVLGELSAAGFPVPPGFVVTAAGARQPGGLDALLVDAAGRVGGDRFAVRSSAAAEDLPDASYAGLYDTFLDVEPARLGAAVRRCLASATSERVAGYRVVAQADRGGAVLEAASGGDGPPMAVLVQRMVDAAAAGVAFTAHPVTGDRSQAVVTAVPGLAESLVSGEDTGEQWTVQQGRAVLTRPHDDIDGVLRADQAAGVADLARQVADRYGRPQDIEWAIDRAGRLWLLQARPMTALPEPVSWAPPGPGLWMRNFRLGEWLPEAVTPLFATWLLPRIEAGYLDGMHASLGVRVPFRYALVNGWYYTAPPIPSPRLLGRVIRQGGARTVRILYHALIRVGRDPAAADRHALAELYRQWQQRLPRYRRLVAAAQAELDTASPARLHGIVDEVAREAGVYLWFLAIVGGSAWKMEAALQRLSREHLTGPLATVDGGVQALLRGLPAAAPAEVPIHAVQSLDWYYPLAGELPTLVPDPGVADRWRDLAAQREAAETACRAALVGRPRLRRRFDAMLTTTQRYAVIREEQARDLSLGWPVLRACARRLGQHLAATGRIAQPDDVFFCTRSDIDTDLGGQAADLASHAAQRRQQWQRQRTLAAPVTIGRAPRLIDDLVEAAVRDARGGAAIPDGAIVGHPASAGRATGPVRIVHGPDDFTAFRTGEVLVARATAPAWTPLFARAAAVVADGGTLAAHASLVAREYGIPAVVGTGDATSRLRTGQVVTVDGTTGIVTTAGP